MKLLLKFECDDPDDIDQVLMVIDSDDDNIDYAKKEARTVLGDCVLTAQVVLDFGHNLSWATRSDFQDQYRPFLG